VARELLADYTDRGWLVELAALVDLGLVPSAVTGALRLVLGGKPITPELVAKPSVIGEIGGRGVLTCTRSGIARCTAYGKFSTTGLIELTWPLRVVPVTPINAGARPIRHSACFRMRRLAFQIARRTRLLNLFPEGFELP
jgi:hypothetical protein